ncbi:MAG: transcriptional regulator [Candidatus Aenigmatarchaeota archaeon]
MKLVCEVFVNDLLPAVRAILARDLVEEHGLTQRETARRLDMTQPAVSQYQNELRGRQVKKIEKSEDVSRKVDGLVEDVAKQRIDMEQYDERFCEICQAAKRASILESRFSCDIK